MPKYKGENIQDLKSRFRNDVFLESATASTDTKVVVIDDNGKVSFNTDAHDKTYTHDQDIPSAQWVITHNLNKYPAVQVIDSGGCWVIGQVTHNSLNQLTLDFRGSFTGKAYMN